MIDTMDPIVQKLGDGSWVSASTGMTRMRMSFSDTNWVQIGLKWVRFHFLKKSKLEKSSIFNGGFAFFELGSFSRFCVFNQRDGR